MGFIILPKKLVLIKVGLYYKFRNQSFSCIRVIMLKLGVPAP